MDTNLLWLMTIEFKQFIVYSDSGYSWRAFLDVLSAGANSWAAQTALKKAIARFLITEEL